MGLGAPRRSWGLYGGQNASCIGLSYRRAVTTSRFAFDLHVKREYLNAGYLDVLSLFMKQSLTCICDSRLCESADLSHRALSLLPIYCRIPGTSGDESDRNETGELQCLAIESRRGAAARTAIACFDQAAGKIGR